MLENKDPLTYSALTYGWVILLSVWGGIVNYCQKYREGKVSRYKLADFIGDVSISGFTGVITFFLCEWANIPGVLSAALVGISGHMGARGLFLLEKVLERRMRMILEIKEKNNRG